MNDTETRLECLRIAQGNREEAAWLYAWVSGQASPAGSAETNLAVASAPDSAAPSAVATDAGSATRATSTQDVVDGDQPRNSKNTTTTMPPEEPTRADVAKTVGVGGTAPTICSCGGWSGVYGVAGGFDINYPIHVSEAGEVYRITPRGKWVLQRDVA